MTTTSSVPEIVAGVDGSDVATQAALWAGAEAARHHIALRLVHAYQPVYFQYPPFVLPTAADDLALAQARRDLDETATVVTAAWPTVTVHADLRHGHPVAILRDAAATARMLVLGSRGLHGFDGLLLGSVAAPVAEHARCPVAVVRGVVDHPDGPVVVGVDGSPISEAAVALAFDEASTRRADLVAVHAWYELPDERLLTLTLRPEQVRQVEAAEHRVLAERLAGWQEKYPDVRVERVVTRMRPAAALLEQATHAQMVVVGSHGRGGFTGMLVGSTSRALLHHAPCPVVVVRPART